MGKKKDLIHAPKKCGGIYDIEYSSENIPYLVCIECNHRINDWEKWEKDYKSLWEEEDNWKDKKNHLTVLLGYFCARYKDYYGIDFTLSLNEKGLFRGPEINVLRRVYSMLENDPWKVKDYMDYIFARKVQKRKKRLTSLSYLAVGDLVREFKFAAKRAEQIDRSTALPPKMLEWIRKRAPQVENYMSLQDFGDLNLLLKYYKSGSLKDSEDISKFVGKLQSMGYVDEQLNISNWRDS